MPKRKMFREHELKNISDARQISTDFVVRIEKERVAAGGSYDKSTDMYTFRVETNNRFEIDWVKNRVSYQQEKGLVVSVPADQLGEGVTLAVETKSGTKKFRMTFSELEDNFTLSIDGLSFLQMPRYEEAIDEGKIVIPPLLSVTDWSFRFAFRLGEPDCRAGRRLCT